MIFFTKWEFLSEILNKELYLLPVLKKDDQIYVYNQNFIIIIGEVWR